MSVVLFGELCQRKEKGHQVTSHSSLSHVSFSPSSFCFFISSSSSSSSSSPSSFSFLRTIAPPSMVTPPWPPVRPTRSDLFFSHSFILYGCANASSMRFCFVLCLLPTPETPQCLFPRHHHYLSLSHGSVGVLPSPFALGPFVGGVRSLFHLCYFSFFLLFLHLCATIAPWLPRAAGPCTSGATSTCHPLWWFLLFSTRGD